MTLEVGLAILGIAITILFGVIGVRAVTRNKQKQVVKGSGAAIQSGRDTKIGGK